MIILITGGSGSGKSEYAENLAVKLKSNDLLYIATMMPQDEESVQRIIRHQNMRKDKGFETKECYTNLKELNIKNSPTVLLECMSNLLANEMYSEEGILMKKGYASVCEEIMEGITYLERICEHVIIVSNEVFSDNGSVYEETTSYIKLLGEINCHIAVLASAVYEVVCGIPVCQKGAGIL
jgi:adenosylcobinamide kinase / adenosylcobinamide-phosphate guanylyltransferase